MLTRKPLGTVIKFILTQLTRRGLNALNELNANEQKPELSRDVGNKFNTIEIARSDQNNTVRLTVVFYDFIPIFYKVAVVAEVESRN